MILEEVGLGKVVDKVRDSVEGLARQIYPDLVGPSGLDSAKAFTVEYDAEEEAKDKELSTHFDNAEVWWLPLLSLHPIEYLGLVIYLLFNRAE